MANYGTILGGTNGVAVYGAGQFSFDDAATGTITGGNGLIVHASTLGADVITNAGLIAGSLSAGLTLTRAGAFDLVNTASGHITGIGPALFVSANQVSISNDGLIEGSDYGAFLSAGVVNVTNLASGQIEGAHFGVLAPAGQLTLDNSGCVVSTEGNGVRAFGGAFASVISEATGLIGGSHEGLDLEHTVDLVDNRGLITSPGGIEAIYKTGTLSSILNEVGGTITGTDEGVFSEYGEAVSNAGYIIGESDVGVALYDGGELVNSGVISGGQYGVNDYGGFDNATLTNFVTLLNSGDIAGGEIGIHVGDKSGARITNTDGGLIAGGTYGISIGYRNDTATSFGTIFNAVGITGGRAGIALVMAASSAMTKAASSSAARRGLPPAMPATRWPIRPASRMRA